jgi:hypothetical protein
VPVCDNHIIDDDVRQVASKDLFSGFKFLPLFLPAFIVPGAVASASLLWPEVLVTDGNSPAFSGERIDEGKV